MTKTPLMSQTIIATAKLSIFCGCHPFSFFLKATSSDINFILQDNDFILQKLLHIKHPPLAFIVCSSKIRPNQKPESNKEIFQYLFAQKRNKEIAIE